MNLDNLFEIYLESKLLKASERTVVLYRRSIASFETTLGRKALVSDLTDKNLERHLWRVVKNGRSPATANKDYHQLTAIWRFANRNRMIDSWPNVKPLREPEKVPLGWLKAEVDKLVASATCEPGEVCGVRASIWWRTLLLIMLDTGERIGAVRQLVKENHIGDHLLFPASIRKGKTRDKLYPLSKDTIASLSQLKKCGDSEFLFPWNFHYWYIYPKFSKILERAGLPTDSRSKFHRIRRTVASAVANTGGNPSSALDHSNPRVTKKYLDPRIVQEKSTSDHVQEWRKKKDDNQNDQKEAG